MKDTYFKLCIHTILYLNNDEFVINSELKKVLYNKFKSALTDKKCELLAIGGSDNHIHLLYTQSPFVSVHETILYLKDNTMNCYKNQDIPADIPDLAWSDGYYAYSVSEYMLEKVQKHIENQEAFHTQMTFEDEMLNLNRLHNVDTSECEYKEYKENFDVFHWGYT